MHNYSTALYRTAPTNNTPGLVGLDCYTGNMVTQRDTVKCDEDQATSQGSEIFTELVSEISGDLV